MSHGEGRLHRDVVRGRFTANGEGVGGERRICLKYTLANELQVGGSSSIHEAITDRRLSAVVHCIATDLQKGDTKTAVDKGDFFPVQGCAGTVLPRSVVGTAGSMLPMPVSTPIQRLPLDIQPLASAKCALECSNGAIYRNLASACTLAMVLQRIYVHWW